MKNVDYSRTETLSGASGKYPLSTEALDFIQDQIRLLESLAAIGGKNYILRLPDGEHPGVAVISKTDMDGHRESEMVEVDAKPLYSPLMNYLTVTTESTNIEADGETYVNARVFRRAQFTKQRGAESYNLNSFANISGRLTSDFPTNEALSTQLKQLPRTVLQCMKEPLEEKLTAKAVAGLTVNDLDGLKTPMLLTCTESIGLFNKVTDYTLVVTAQGNGMVRQEIIQEFDEHYVRTFDGESWSRWARKSETAMHLDVKIVGSTVYVRHGALPADCDIVLLRKKKRGAFRRTGGENALPKNQGVRQRRAAKNQYVHFKGIRLTKGIPGKWYVPRCVGVDNPARDSNLVGKELPGLCASLFYRGEDGYYRMQGSRKKIILKSTLNYKGTQHSAYAMVGLQIARVKTSPASKDSGGEIVRLKYRVQQLRHTDEDGRVRYTFVKRFSQC